METINCYRYSILIAFVLGLSACGDGGGRGNNGGNPGSPTNQLSMVKYWAYQIQAISEPGAVDALVNSHYDMLVLDPTRTDWSSDDRFFDTKGMVIRLKNSKGSDNKTGKIVLAYIDIGEAEDWRWYWNWSKDWPIAEPRPPADWPDYIITRDPDGWAGNYPVAYWHPDWKDIIIHGKNQPSSSDRDYTSVIDEVIKSGFDGIYLDWVEAYEDSNIMAQAASEGKDPAVEMIRFIREMREYARQRNPDFLIIQQNAVELLDGHPELLEVIDAIAQEEVWYGGDATDNWNDLNGVDYINGADVYNFFIENLDQYLAKGIPVFNVEYALIHAGVGYSKALAKGYIPYCSRRSLSQLTTTPPPGY